MGLYLKLLVKPAQILRTLTITKSIIPPNKPMHICCGKRVFLIAKHNYMGNSVKLYSTSPSIPKKKLLFRMPEVKRLITLAKPEKWRLLGKIW